MRVFILLSVTLVATLASLVSSEPRVICYWPSWSIRRKGDFKHAPEDINGTLCTHIHYAYAVLDEKNLKPIDSNGSPQVDLYHRINALKKKYPDLKHVLSIGGWKDPARKYSYMVSTSEKRKRFIHYTIEYLQKYHFDGLDIDWGFPVCWQGKCNHNADRDKENFGMLLHELHDEFRMHNPKYSLSAAVISGNDIANKAYDFGAMANYLDYVNVMTYDSAGAYNGHTGHHSAIEASKSALQFYNNKGIPKEKICIDVPFYGHTFTLKDPNKHGYGDPTTGDGKRWKSEENGNAYFWEICVAVKKEGWKKGYNQDGHDPYAYHDDQWVGYDDTLQAYEKSKWVKDNGYGGVIIWEITQDDFHKRCCNVTHPMLKAINFGLFGKGDNPNTYGCESDYTIM